MKNKKLLVGGMALCLLIISGCQQNTSDVPAGSDKMGQASTQVSNTNNVQGSIQVIAPMDETIAPELSKRPELSKEEAATFEATLPLATRQQMVKDLVAKMPSNSLQAFQNAFPDLTMAATYNYTEEMNMLKAGSESWYHSLEGNFTVVFYNDTGTPINIFQGDRQSAAELNSAAGGLKAALGNI